MGQLSQLIVMVEAQGVDAVLDALGKVDTAQTKLASDAQKNAGRQKSAAGTIKATWQEMATGINQAMGIARTAINTGKAVFDFAKEGAQLEFVATKFDRLAESVGSSSDVLLGDLREVSRGIMSDAELMDTATTMMTLGLANTHDEAVRLTNVASQLGMSMNQLVLTLTNRTTMRFDTLGVAVAGFDEKLKALEASGLDVQDAFTQAFLQQAEEQIARVGSIADSSAGKLMAFEAALKQLADTGKMNFANNVEAIFGMDVRKVADTFTLDSKIADLAIRLEKAGLNGERFQEQYTGDKGGAFEMLGAKILGFGWDGTTPTKASDSTPVPTWEDIVSTWTGSKKDGAYEDPKQVEQSMRQYGAALEYVSFLQKEYGMTAEEAGAKTQELIDTFGIGVFTMSDSTDEWAAGIEGTNQAVKDVTKSLSFMVASNMSATYAAMGTDWSTMRKMAEGYDEELARINENNARMEELEPFKDTGGYIDGVWKSAKQVRKELQDLAIDSADAEEAMAKMAANMTLSLLQASMGIDGYTMSEIDTLLQYMVDAGLLTQTAADKMKKDYEDAINYANALELDQKIGEILVDVSGYEDGLDIVNGKLVDAKTGEVLADIDTYLGDLKVVNGQIVDTKTGKVVTDLEEFFLGIATANGEELDPKIAEVLADIAPYLLDLLGLPDPDGKEVEVVAKYIDNGLDEPDAPDSVSLDVEYRDLGLTPNVPTESEIDITYDDPGHTPDVPSSVNVGINYIPGPFPQRALGGAVYPGEEYMWQERGREGELFIPGQYGRVMNQVEVAQALREAFSPSKDTSKPSQEPVVNNYYYSLTMPTTSNPADVRTAFELMEAWN